MRKTILAGISLLFISILILSACSSAVETLPSDVDEAVQAGVAATLTKEAWLGGVESARKTAIASENLSPEDDDEEVSSLILPTFTPQPSLTPTLKPVLKANCRLLGSSGCRRAQARSGSSPSPLTTRGMDLLTGTNINRIFTSAPLLLEK